MEENTNQIGQGIITQVSGQNYETIMLHSYSLSLIAKCEFRIANLSDEFRNSKFAFRNFLRAAADEATRKVELRKSLGQLLRQAAIECLENPVLLHQSRRHAEFLISEAQPEVRFRHSRLQRYRLPERVSRISEPSQTEVRKTQTVMRLWHSGIELDRVPELLDSFAILLQLQIRITREIEVVGSVLMI